MIRALWSLQGSTKKSAFPKPSKAFQLEELTTTRTAIADWVKSEVEQHWQQTKSAYLLSRLGYEARQKFPDAPASLPEGIKRFLQDNSIVQIVTHPSIPQKVGAIPFGAELPQDIVSVFSPEISSTKFQRTRFLPELWRSFYSEIKTKRFALFSGPPENPNVRIFDGLEPPPGSESYEIFASDIASTPEEIPMWERASAVESSIKKWALRNNIELKSLLEKSTISSRSEHHPKYAGHSFPLKISSLDQLDQARIMIPLDLVLKLVAMDR